MTGQQDAELDALALVQAALDQDGEALARCWPIATSARRAPP